MSKELEALEEIINKFAEQMMRANKEELTAINKNNAIEYLYRTPQVRLLHQALQHLEAIDNSKPSKALEELEKFKGIELSSLPFKSEDGAVKEVDLNEVRYVGSPLNNDFRKFVYIIENTLIKSQEQEKVLNIIKPLCEVVETPVKKLRYLKVSGVVVYTFKNEEEFELLKQYFKKYIQN